MISAEEESDFISQAKAGNQQAFRKLYESHVDALFAFMSQFSDNREQVREWTQRSFIKAFDKLDSFKAASRFKSWLYTIALNEMRMDMRNNIDFEEFEPQKFGDNHDPDTEVPNNWTETKDAIKELDPDKKIVFLLHIAEEYSHREIGSMLQISEGTSRVILHRAKKKLRQILEL